MANVSRRNSKVFRLVCESLQEMRDIQGVPAYKVCEVVSRRYQGSPPSQASLKIALHRGVQDGYLVYKDRRYNLPANEAKCEPKPKPGLVKRIKRYFSKLMTKQCKPRRRKSKRCKLRRQGAVQRKRSPRKNKPLRRQGAIRRKKPKSSGCGC